MARLAHCIQVRRKGNRRTVDCRIPGLLEFHHVGYDIFTHAGALGPHRHTGLFEICLILRGHVTWWAKDRSYELRGGDVYFTWPDEPHGGLHELMHPGTIYWTTLKIPKPNEPGAQLFLHLPRAEARALCAAVHAMPERHLRGAEKLEPYFQALMTHLESKTLLGVTQARAALQCLLATLATLPRAADSRGFVPPGINRVREFLDSCPQPWPDVAELAELAGMSVSHFHASFLKQVGTAPMEHSHRVRLARAQELLRAPAATVTSVAARLGYCSSQHLAACFRRYLGQTPSDARQ